MTPHEQEIIDELEKEFTHPTGVYLFVVPSREDRRRRLRGMRFLFGYCTVVFLGVVGIIITAVTR